ncbi:hypothetical protein [Rhodocyclus tenuis]|uniref:hypothetical protein n=1 Tax=Rhodocyclus tenuis TaxID=1066 RepID=UPI001907541A|nr:hypothetical protein [Rhodocyclus tenuis]
MENIIKEPTAKTDRPGNTITHGGRGLKSRFALHRLVYPAAVESKEIDSQNYVERDDL